MDILVAKIKERGTAPTRADIAELLAGIDKPGKKQAEKEQAVLDLYAALGNTQFNGQGHSVASTLDSYEEF